ncbi:type II secretion system protein GspG [Thalassotalea insulae]|uniref:Type II secretion system core protein G n=1 Tax=Thalassotalea insulae TaxID=2056778 RepID=A0ABQ6GNS2_9GAMM|nr:type II secretion system major pseudopilin GspG [Thalassotalea insulae]GLX77592.1 type II secretion system protein GspG [Thalassotalea insulae]
MHRKNIFVQNKLSKSSYCRGFTLIELLIVMVILGLLASLVAPKMFGKIGSSKQKTAQTQIEMLSTALDMYRLDVGHYPDSLKELRHSNKPNWQGPYLPKNIPNDPWGNAYVYKFPGDITDYELMSYGSDGKLGGEGESSDISY